MIDDRPHPWQNSILYAWLSMEIPYFPYTVLIESWLILINVDNRSMRDVFSPQIACKRPPQQATCFSCSFSEPRLHRLQTCTCSRKGRNNPRFRKGSPGCSSAGLDAGWNGFAYRYNAINGEADLQWDQAADHLGSAEMGPADHLGPWRRRSKSWPLDGTVETKKDIWIYLTS